MSETFDEFLASRPQLVRDPDARPVPGWCDCPRWSIGDKPIFHRHAAGCDATGEAAEAFTFVGADRVMKATTLEALAAWIPAPPAPPAQDPAATAVVIKRMLALGFHLVALPAGTKKPRGRGWNDPEQTPALTFEQASAHVADGGGLGVLLGPSDLIVIDAENAAATAALVAAGYTPVLYTAKGMNPVRCDPRANKIGGGHFWFRRPLSIPAEQLSNVPQKVVGDGGLVDVLGAPGSMAVVPPTALVEAAGWRYTAEGHNRLWHGDGLPEAPMWLFAPAAECPTGLENLHGGLAPKAPVERGAHDEATQELTDAVDGIAWDAVEALDDRLEDWGDADDDGCPVRHWRGADHRKSVTMHDCGRGRFAHVWSGTMRAALGMGDRESVSPLSLACLLVGKEDRGADVREVAQRFGLRLGGEQELDTITPDSLEEAAAEFEATAQAGGTTETKPIPSPGKGPKGEPVGRVIEVEIGTDGLLRRAQNFRSAAAVMRAKQHVVAPQPAAVLIGAGSVVGLPASLATAPAIGGLGSTAPESGSAGPIDAEAMEQTDDSASTGSELDPDAAIEGELLDETDAAAEARKTLHELRPKIKEIERQLAQMTPGLKRVADCAESNGVFMHGLLGSLLPRIVASVPPNVLLPPRNGDLSYKVKGQGINQYGVQVAPSSAGKSETDNAAEAAIPLQHGVAQIGNGTSESWSKELRGKQDGKRYIKTTSLIVQIDEVADFNEQLLRTGSKMKGWLAASWMNGGGGQSTSDEKNSAHMPKHGSRIGISVNAQPGRMDVLAALADQGAQHRFFKTMAGLVRSTERGPLYGISVPPVMADQSSMPWFSLGHVGEPPIACQQPQAARDAAGPAAAPPIVNKGAPLDQGDGTEKLGVTGFDDADPIWFQLCETAKRDIAEALDVAADRAENWDQAFDQDQGGLVTGHRVAMKLHVSAALAVLDGTLHIDEAMWEAAELFQVGSDLTAAACAAYMELSGEAEAYRQGHLKGVGQAAARAADATVTSRGVQSSMSAIIRNLQKVGGSSMPGYVTGNLSKSQKAHAAQAAEALQRGGLLQVELNGRWTLIGQAAIAA
ncbi:hypothetical protein E3G71_001081 [Mycobacteroides abscessus]|uniref:bifunctional DNA primase/polymerase n=1 Tax=Mycobacteroides abscessus TaxID=36809 RepID=UPI001878D55B|nr:bifunctional DNA primase/polymerase [Mycobacteroides abscessus]MBE5488580.1 hypothetical protein [Mycobacteroides abscessus]MBE5518176.1 hypothetical protein [Mycobacteroides abscessus]MBN7311004.1 bifunctional DNA primase/polymerase [Mycobacteroides abscessus subsp. abscessus]